MGNPTTLDEAIAQAEKAGTLKKGTAKTWFEGHDKYGQESEADKYWQETTPGFAKEMFDSSRNDQYTEEDNSAEANLEMRTQTQCALLSFVGNKDAKLKAMKNTRSLRGRAPGKGGTYRYVKIINSNDPAVFLSQTMAIPDASLFFGISNQKLSSLYPYAKVFQIINKGKGRKNEKLEEIPTGLTFWQAHKVVDPKGSFDKWFSKGSLNHGEVGLRSVEYVYKGTNPAEVNSHLDCTLKYHFSNIKGLNAPYIGKGKSFTQLIVRKGQCGNVASFQENVLRGNFGWNYPRDLNLIDKKLARALLLGRNSLTMYLKNHEFTINQDGSADLTITYASAIEAALNNNSAANLIYNDKLDDKIRQKRNKLKKIRKMRKGQVDEAKRVGAKGPKANKAETALEREVAAHQRQAAHQGYHKILDTLLNSKYIKYITVPIEAVGKLTHSKIIDQNAGDNKRKDYEIGGKTFNAANRDKSQLLRCLKQDMIIKRAVQSESEDGTDFRTGGKPDMGKVLNLMRKQQGLSEDNQADEQVWSPDKIKEARKLYGESFGHDKENFFKVEDQTVDIAFCHFGDLIEAGARILKGKSTSREVFGEDFSQFPIIVTGPIVVPDMCPEIGKRRVENIADLPVSLDLVVDMWLNKIVRKGKTTYEFRRYLQDMMFYLLPKVLGSECNGLTELPNMIPRVDFVTLRGVPDKKGRYRAPHRVVGGRGIHIDTTSFVSDRRKIEWNADGMEQKSFEYVLLYAEMRDRSLLNGKKKQDEANGIYHLPIGTDSAAIRDYSFSKNDTEYYSEAKVMGSMNSKDCKDDISGGIVYNLSIKMAGNGFFKPGQLLYVDMQPLGWGSINNLSSMQNQLRVGGYYAITKVTSHIDEDGYHTTLESLYYGNPEIFKQNRLRTLRLRVEAAYDLHKARLGFKYGKVQSYAESIRGSGPMYDAVVNAGGPQINFVQHIFGRGGFFDPLHNEDGTKKTNIVTTFLAPETEYKESSCSTICCSDVSPKWNRKMMKNDGKCCSSC